MENLSQNVTGGPVRRLYTCSRSVFVAARQPMETVGRERVSALTEQSGFLLPELFRASKSSSSSSLPREARPYI
jgi:hypothetical protein